VTQHVDVAIGMNAPVSDEAARLFASQFYSAVGFGTSIEVAFNQAISRLMVDASRRRRRPNCSSRKA
jgi:hypothetical protein